ncbi:sortase B protein-sorting domain-containing protein [Anaerotignum sp.]
MKNIRMALYAILFHVSRCYLVNRLS